MLRNYLDIFIIAYIDDILVYSENKKDYVEYVKVVLKVLKTVYLRLKLKKYKFNKIELKFLGIIIST